MDAQKTGGFLKELRNEKGMTQAQLAEAFQVSNRTVSRWETGTNLPDIAKLTELAEYYQVDIQELIDGNRHPDPMTEEARQAASKAADYVETEKQILIRRVIIINCIVLIFGLIS